MILSPTVMSIEISQLYMPFVVLGKLVVFSSVRIRKELSVTCES